MKKENQAELHKIKKRGLNEAQKGLRQIEIDLEVLGYPDLAEELDVFIDKVVREIYWIRENDD